MHYCFVPVEDFALSFFSLLIRMVIADDSEPHLFCLTTAKDAYPFQLPETLSASDFVSIISSTTFACTIM